MSYNLSFMLSLFFLIPMLLFSGDLVCIQSIQNHLDSFALTVAYEISMEGEISQEIEELVSNELGAEIYCVDNCRGGHFGDTVTFVLAKEYTPFIMSDKPMKISVRRTAVIGYYMG